MPRSRFLVALVAGALVGTSGSARAGEDEFCRTLAEAWTTARDAPQTLGDRRIAGATLCAPQDGNLQCSWLLGTRENGRAAYARFKAEAAGCLAPLGLKPTELDVAGSLTTLFDGEATAPQVAVIYPGQASVSIAVLLQR